MFTPATSPHTLRYTRPCLCRNLLIHPFDALKSLIPIICNNSAAFDRTTVPFTGTFEVHTCLNHFSSTSSSFSKFLLRIRFRVLEFPSLQANSKVLRFARIVFNVDEGILSGLVLLGPTFLLLVFAHAILLDRKIFVVLVFILLGRQVFVVLVSLD
ncbi:hypothetical protein T02_7103 [Trichinella nativa]|uniref:Transmembrane protein n=1 Tax=Trichinella nativa TaxID=6335 RepID=A0A0V1LPT3_9BILA|nr:hypothetical protein T02_7103 [Trichinella nativa]